jgi:hypothetical protein
VRYGPARLLIRPASRACTPTAQHHFSAPCAIPAPQVNGSSGADASLSSCTLSAGTEVARLASGIGGSAGTASATMLLRTTSVSQRTEAYAKLAGLAGPVPGPMLRMAMVSLAQNRRRDCAAQCYVAACCATGGTGRCGRACRGVCTVWHDVVLCRAEQAAHAVMQIPMCGCVEADRRRIERSAAPSLRTSGELRAEPHKHPHCCDDLFRIICSRRTAPE